MSKIALVTVAYNRVDSLKRLIESLKRANYDENRVDLIISIDKSDTNTVEEYAKTVNWNHGEIRVKTHTNNLGLRKHILSQGKEFSDYDALIILEDDVVVAKDFFKYSLQMINTYGDDENIAGISLYSFPMNQFVGRPFTPVKNEFDVFLMQQAQSWGQIWLKNQWLDFYKWYLDHEDFTFSQNVPKAMFGWNKSWLKYHTRYCIEKNKYFIYPYIPFSSNFGDAGTHALTSYSAYQNCLPTAVIFPLNTTVDLNRLVKYDAFFENEGLYDYLDLSKNNCLLDINGYRDICEDKKYLLSSKHLNYKIVKSWGLVRRPQEMNIFEDQNGDDIYLYDTTSHFTNTFTTSYPQNLILYSYRIDSIVAFTRRYGLSNIIKQFCHHLLNKIH